MCNYIRINYALEFTSVYDHLQIIELILSNDIACFLLLLLSLWQIIFKNASMLIQNHISKTILDKKKLSPHTLQNLANGLPTYWPDSIVDKPSPSLCFSYFSQ